MTFKRNRGQYYEESDTGDEYISPARTVTEADVASFAALTGDYSPIYTDQEYCRRRGLDGRIAHGLLGLGMVEGLLSRVAPAEGRGVASLGWHWRFLQPIRPGDTLRIRWRIVSKRLSRRRPGQGVVEEAIRLINQRGEIAQEGIHGILLQCRTAAGILAANSAEMLSSSHEQASGPEATSTWLPHWEDMGGWTATWEQYISHPQITQQLEEAFEETGISYDDLRVGQSFTSPRRTVIEGDIMVFAGVTGDYAMIHTDEEYCRITEYGTRIAHGLLGLSFVEGLRYRLGTDGGVGIGAVSLEWKWSFRKPVRPQDTLHGRWTIREKRPIRGNSDGGIIVLDVSLMNHREEVVQDGQHIVLIPRRVSAREAV